MLSAANGSGPCGILSRTRSPKNWKLCAFVVRENTRVVPHPSAPGRYAWPHKTNLANLPDLQHRSWCQNLDCQGPCMNWARCTGYPLIPLFIVRTAKRQVSPHSLAEENIVPTAREISRGAEMYRIAMEVQSGRKESDHDGLSLSRFSFLFVKGWKSR